MTGAVEGILRETWVRRLVGYTQHSHVLLVAQAVVTNPVGHDTECPSKVELDRLVVLSVRTDCKFATGSFLQRPEFKPIAMWDKDRIKDFLTLSEPLQRARHSAKDGARNATDQLQLGPLLILGEFVSLHRRSEPALRAEREPLQGNDAGSVRDAPLTSCITSIFQATQRDPLSITRRWRCPGIARVDLLREWRRSVRNGPIAVPSTVGSKASRNFLKQRWFLLDRTGVRCYVSWANPSTIAVGDRFVWG